MRMFLKIDLETQVLEYNALLLARTLNPDCYVFTVVQLKCAIQMYAWGKVGQSSKVAQLAGGTEETFGINEELTYAEVSLIRRTVVT